MIFFETELLFWLAVICCSGCLCSVPEAIDFYLCVCVGRSQSSNQPTLLPMRLSVLTMKITDPMELFRPMQDLSKRQPLPHPASAVHISTVQMVPPAT